MEDLEIPSQERVLETAFKRIRRGVRSLLPVDLARQGYLLRIGYGMVTDMGSLNRISYLTH